MPGANPTIVSCKNLQRSEFYIEKKSCLLQNAGVVVAISKVVGLAPGAGHCNM
jgi:hypothetical protein